MNQPFRSILLKFFLILTISALAGIISNKLNSQPIPLIRPAISRQPGDSSEILDIDLAQAYLLFQEGNAIFIDARTPEEFQAGHIRNALNIPQQTSRAEKVQIFLRIPSDKIVVTYCGQAECNLSKELAIQMSQSGFQHLRIFFGGWEAWKHASYPTEP